jgi:hypothetical protein
VRFLATFAAAFVSALVVAFPILPFGLGSPLAVPLAFLCGALASGLGAWAAGGRQGRLLPVLGYSLASVVVLAVPLGAVLFFVARTSLSISAPIVLAVVAAASAYAARRRGLGGTGGTAEGRAGPAKTVAALAALAVLLLLLLPVADLGYLWITACRGEERAVFEEFPQYGPRTPQKLDPRPDIETFLDVGGACVVTYRTPGVASEITGYFEERWKENGWERPPELGPRGTGDLLYVRRGDYEYRLSFADDPGGSAQGGTRGVVSVRKP